MPAIGFYKGLVVLIELRHQHGPPSLGSERSTSLCYG